MTDTLQDVDTVGKTEEDTLEFTVPQDAPSEADRGKKVEKKFSYTVISTPVEAHKVIAQKEWDLVELVNRKLKGDARSNAYQSLTLQYKPSTVSPEEIKERAIRDLMRIGIPEEMAKAQVEAMLNAKNGVQG